MFKASYSARAHRDRQRFVSVSAPCKSVARDYGCSTYSTCDTRAKVVLKGGSDEGILF